MVREKDLENNFFPGQGKVREFRDCLVKLGKDLKNQGILKLMAMAVSKDYTCSAQGCSFRKNDPCTEVIILHIRNSVLVL